MFSCQDPHYTYIKANTFGDIDTANKIMREMDPVEMKSEKHVVGFDHNSKGYEKRIARKLEK